MPCCSRRVDMSSAPKRNSRSLCVGTNRRMRSNRSCSPRLRSLMPLAQVGQNLHAPALGGPMDLEDLNPAVQVGLLPAAGHAGVSHGGFRLITWSQECGPVVVPGATKNFAGGQQLARALPTTQCVRARAQQTGRLTNSCQSRLHIGSFAWIGPHCKQRHVLDGGGQGTTRVLEVRREPGKDLGQRHLAGHAVHLHAPATKTRVTASSCSSSRSGS